MPEQPQWSERTLDMPPQDPWADPATAPGASPAGFPQSGPAQPATAPVSGGSGFPGSAAPQPHGAVPQSPFNQGRAQVTPHPPGQRFGAEHEPTGTGWPGDESPHAERPPLAWRMRELRRGGEWSSAAALFAFVCWGIWALSTGDDLTTPVVVFVLSLVVAAGLFALSRAVGRLVWEKQFGRVRRTARGAHMVAAVFLVGVGIAHLQQTQWVMDAYHWVVSTF
ncbi:DNA-directed RNA polymerase II [Mangrovihabitans endophyticus]|uniref:Uncharacterized protein n=1 Tax=Mangrovihabitans endophyticus TaxID=1751298 RepID=A0A8J3C5C3_9ACTN|nr:DNA-directed RNA polymerase II [Mangrovihabitans endophyticus]GGL20142.1 hypothetical protein GCM10012284_63460 [Mangrovihabitans endophyticus]